jgi:putative transposase
LCKRKDGSYYLNIQLESQPAEPPPSNHVLGCDLGRTDIAVTSDGDPLGASRFCK